MSRQRLAVVTGAAGGIGTAVSRRLAFQGYDLVLVERDLVLARKAVAELGTGQALACDLSDRQQVAEFARQLQAWGPDLHVVVWNAGVIVPGDVIDTDTAKVDLQLAVMLTSVITLSAAAAKVMTVYGTGHILATVSMGALVALPGSATYSAAKAGLRAFLTALAGELQGTGVTVSGIYPSAVDTPMLQHEALHGGSVLNFVGKVSTADDVADGFMRALRTRRLEIYVPYSDSWTCRMIQFWPWLLPLLLPVLERIGGRGQRRYLVDLTTPCSNDISDTSTPN